MGTVPYYLHKIDNCSHILDYKDTLAVFAVVRRACLPVGRFVVPAPACRGPFVLQGHGGHGEPRRTLRASMLPYSN